MVTVTSTPSDLGPRCVQSLTLGGRAQPFIAVPQLIQCASCEKQPVTHLEGGEENSMKVTEIY